MKLKLDSQRLIVASFKWLVLSIVVLIAISVVILFLLKIPELYFAEWALDMDLTTKDLLQRQNELRSSIATVLTGAALFIGLYLTYRNIKLTQDNAQATLRLTEEGKITERFSKAIEQLGNKESLAIRLGGIYALERIAKDSERDHWQVMEVLTAFVRESAPWNEAQAQTRKEQLSLDFAGSNNQGGMPPSLKVATDVQAALAVIGRRVRVFEHGKNQRLDLHLTDLRGAGLREAHLEGTHLEGAHLEGATLYKAHLEGASLVGAHLEEAELDSAHLEGARLVSANLKGAVLNDAHLEEASLTDAHMEGAYLVGAHLRGVSLHRAHLQGASLEGATGLTLDQIKKANIDAETKLPDYIQLAIEAELDDESELQA